MFHQATDHTQAISVTAGHWTNPTARTGCTAVLFDRPAPAVVDVRGGAPGTRETALLGAGDLVQSVDAILLTGGSAYGLEAASGVMDYLRERGRGVRTPAGPVPIVPAAVIFDLGSGEPAWPTRRNAYDACVDARPLASLERGRVGAGCGATTRKIFPGTAPERGGIGVARVDLGNGGSVSAIVVVNAAGEVVLDRTAADARTSILDGPSMDESRSSTTLAVVIIDAPGDRRMLTRCAVSAHDGFARMIRPCHTIVDGDVVFAVGLRVGDVTPRDVIVVSTAVELAVERAIIDAVTA